MSNETQPLEFQQPSEPQILARYERPGSDLALTPVFNLEEAQRRLEELQKFVKFYLREGEDFGTIPGTPKPTLYKPGADKLCDIYALADTYRITNRVEDWSKNLFDYEIECSLLSKRTGGLVATGVGSCNSYEGKYRWRETKRKCPNCEKETIIKGKKEFTRGQAGFENGGWVCWKKEGKSDGCGTKFPDAEEAITSQVAGKVENDDIATLKNTLLKMAKKRAKVDAVLSATRSSGLFTQDIEDWSVSPDEGSVEAAQGVAKAKIAEHEAEKAAKATSEPPKASNGQSDVVFSLFYVQDGDGYLVTGPKVLTHEKDVVPLLRPLWDGSRYWATADQLGKLISRLEGLKPPVPMKKLESNAKA